MSHFIALRQQIKVIETIKKTTGAMRLISMSMHSRLRNQKTVLENYTNEIKRIDEEIRQTVPVHTEPPAARPEPQRTVIILVGSQKGLCGSFNEQLFRYFETEHSGTQADIILTVGKHATEHIKKDHTEPYRSYDQFSSSNFTVIAQQITKILLTQQNASILIFSNIAPTFLSQKPHKTALILRSLQPQDAFLNYLNKLQLKSILLHTLYESLLAEQAARFLSMDLAYRNAEEILVKKRLDYNKTRQAYVTRELIELSGGMIAQE